MGRLLCGPRFIEMALTGKGPKLELMGTSAAYLVCHSPPAEYTRLTITTDAATDLQVTLLRLPESRARLSMTAAGSANTVRLSLTAHDAAVSLEDAAWERSSSTSNRPEDTSYRPEATPEDAVRSWFGTSHLQAGETCTSQEIALPAGSGPVMFKVLARDASGQRVTAWTLVEPR
jgi:hypothetical protein